MKILMKIIHRKRENNESESSCFVKNEFMNRMILLENSKDAGYLEDHVYTVLGAGYETSANATAHCILFLALHPDVQEKAYQEIMEVFPTDDSTIDMNTLADLEYLDRIFKESLRLAPVVPSMAREALKDFELAPGNIVKKGSVFIIDLLGFHRRRDLWGDDANQFNPDRFLPENFVGKEQFFIPFSLGKRNCLGNRYAPVSFKIVIMKLLRSFKFSSSLKYEEIKFTRHIALKLIGPHSVSIQKR